MKHSDSIKELAEALAAFQFEVTDPSKEADNPFFKSKYVTLDGLINTVRPILASHGLSFMQMPAGDGQNISITTVLMHKSGEWIESEPFILKATKVDPQGAGSAVTYGRRYSLGAILGIGWQPDDDGNQSSYNAQNAPQQSKNNNATVNTNNHTNDPHKVAMSKLKAKVKELNISNTYVTAIIKQFFSKNNSTELTPTEIYKLKDNISEYMKTVKVD